MGELMGEFVQCQWVSVWYASGRVCMVCQWESLYSVCEFVWYVGGRVCTMSVGICMVCRWESLYSVRESLDGAAGKFSSLG